MSDTSMHGHVLRMGLSAVLAVLVGAAVIVSATGSGVSSAASAALKPVADSYVRIDQPQQNFGTATTLMVGGRPRSIAYLRFRVAVPTGHVVAGATLRLDVRSKSRARFTVQRAARSAWGEKTIRYANAPPFRAVATAAAAVRPGPTSVSVDVSRLVTGSGVVSLALQSAARSPLVFGARESGRSGPRLLIDTSVAAPDAETGAGGSAPASPSAGAPAVGSGGAVTGGGTADASSGGGGGGSSGSGSGGSGGGGGSSGSGSGGGGSGGSGGGISPAPCGTAKTPPPRIDHVIWIWMENKPYDSVIGSPAAPYENQLAAACGLATNYAGVAHPSLPNYIAATSGSTQGIADDNPPSSHPLAVESIYSQLKAIGKTWRAYEESAPGSCPLTSSGQYAVKHDPAPYYTGVAGDCASWDVPMGTTDSGSFLTDLNGGTLPAFSFVTPNLCNDTHDCSVATGDAWLKSWFDKILTSQTYLAGRTVIFVVWDEDDGSPSNHVPLIVVNPSTPAGARSATAFDHYSLLKTTEQLLGIGTYLGHAADAGTSSMVASFDLG